MASDRESGKSVRTSIEQNGTVANRNRNRNRGPSDFSDGHADEVAVELCKCLF
jgi:hypothetical protein